MKAAASLLRSIILAKNDGEFLGDEREVAQLIAIEQRIRSDVFGLIDSPYVKFIFQINISFGERRLSRQEADKAARAY
jgi:hypothetical protein